MDSTKFILAFLLSFLIFYFTFHIVAYINNDFLSINQTKIEQYCYEKGFLRSDFRYVHNHSLAVRCFDPQVFVVESSSFEEH